MFSRTFEKKKEKSRKIIFEPKNYFINRYDLFNEKDYNNFMINNTNIFLNITKIQKKKTDHSGITISSNMQITFS